MNTQLFLTSSVHAVAHDVANKLDLSKTNKLVFIDTAAEKEREAGEDMEWLVNDRQALVDAGFKVTDYTITGKNKETLEQDLKDFDYIYLSGGSSAYLLDESRKSGFSELIHTLVVEQGKTYIGTSAGSIVAGPRLLDYFLTDELELDDISGYGLVNFTLVPHWGSKSFREAYLGERRNIAYRNNQVPLLVLTDSQYVHVVDGKMEIINVIDK